MKGRKRKRAVEAAAGQPGKRAASDDALPGNYMPEACKGCVIVHTSHPRIIGSRPVASGRRSLDARRPFRWDPREGFFTVANAEPCTRFAFLTFTGTDVRDRDGGLFEKALTRDDAGNETSVTTFVIVVEPFTALSLCRTDQAPDLYGLPFLPLKLPATPSVPESLPPALRFPLPVKKGPYLCTQGVGGHLTHFFAESFHAIDLRCPCGTPVLSAGDGVVKALTQRRRCSGIHCANLQKWNSVTVHLDCGFIVEYLHIAPGSSLVRPGETVRAGQVLCETGDIGFAPEAHLHIELHSACDADGPSVPLRFGTEATAFVPIAGQWYSPTGRESPRSQP
eukprot:TRINITY_DN45526_c0_g1_i1.p1 TRINITY_DN45526_c0_g1~~TRINITY_DN45526_c0_g1_i1.p1  ORF type:complete len:337 (-),score=28.12 TRINITY_DN45526_c0_g1_i1:125-1135(-)